MSFSLNVGTLALLSVAGCLVGCGPTGLSAPPPPETTDTSVGPGDLFDVRIYGEEDLSSDFRVAEDGTIDFPYLGRVEVADLSPGEIADLLESRLQSAGVLVSPEVSVLVTEYNSKRVSITGAVRNPGSYSLRPGLTALQAIGDAGGTTDLANRDAATVTRRVDGRMRRYSIPLDRITMGTSDDIRIRSGDIIFVPERPF